MMGRKLGVLISFIIALILTGENTKNISKDKKIICMDYISLLETGKTAMNTLDIVRGTTLVLKCRFCNDSKNFRIIKWTYKMRGAKRYQTINQRTIENKSINNVILRDLDTLEITFFSLSHSGIYICNYMDVHYEGIFVYVLDEVFNDSVPLITGSINEWYVYREKYLESTNRKFESKNENSFFPVAKLKFTFKIVTIWGDWGQCEPVSSNNGIRRKIAKCFLHPYLHKNYLKHSDSFDNLTQFFCEEPYDLPCRSVLLSKKLPDVSKITRYIPHFEVKEHCEVIKGYPHNNLKDSEHSIVKYLAESGHITLQCDEILIESQVEWYKDGCRLNSTFRNNLGSTEDEPHIAIDSRNSLYILHASKREEGTYVCFIDGERKQSYKIKVVSMSRLLNQEFFRYSMYLAFVLSLTLVCYCTGIVVAWHRRTSFLDPF